jgi:hypothetical protein
VAGRNAPGTRLRGMLRASGLLVVALSLGRPTAAQQVSALLARASSANILLPHPDGFGLGGEASVGDWLLRLDLVRFADETRREGRVCRSPGFWCDVEEVTASVSLTGLRAVASRALRVGSVIRLSAGGGVSFGAVSVTATGASGLRAFLHVPNDGQLGWLGLASMEIVPVAGFPLRLVGTYAAHWQAFRGCVDPAEPTSGDAFFCGTDLFQEVMVGVAWDLSGIMGG